MFAEVVFATKVGIVELVAGYAAVTRRLVALECTRAGASDKHQLEPLAVPAAAGAAAGDNFAGDLVPDELDSVPAAEEAYIPEAVTEATRAPFV